MGAYFRKPSHDTVLFILKMKIELNPVVQAIASWLEGNNRLEDVRALYLKQAALVEVWSRRTLIFFSPKQAQHYSQLGKSLLQVGNLPAALAACQRAIELAPDSAWAYFALAEVQQVQGEWAAAIESFQRAAELDSQVSWFHYGLGKAYLHRENWQAAVTAFRKARDLDPKEFWACYCLGEALLKAGHSQEAIAVLKTAITLQSAFPWSYYHLGDACLAEEQLEEAIAAYQAALRLRPNNPYMRQNLDYALNLQQQEQKIKDYCQHLQGQPSPETGQLTILMIMPYAPYPPKTGANARMFHELKSLGQKHRVVLASLMFAKEDYQLETQLEEYCDLAILVAIGDAPVRQAQEPKLVNRYSSKRLRILLQQLQAIPFDVVSCNFIYMAQYAELFPDAFHVLAEHNIESELLKRSAEVQEAARINQLAQQTDAVKAFVEAEADAQLLAAYEDRMWAQFPLRTVVSDRDKHILDSRCSPGQTLVVNNGIDTYNTPLLSRSTQKRMLFIGTMSYYPNIDAVNYCVEEVLPHVWEADPTIEFWVAGAMPPPQIMELGQHPQITVIPNPEDMSEVAQACSVSVVPVRFGSGTRIKILHSMAMGLPIVSTSLGCEGLAVENNTHLLIEDDPAQFAASVVKLMANKDLQQTLRDSGRQLVEESYDWQAIYAEAEQQYVTHYQHWTQR